MVTSKTSFFFIGCSSCNWRIASMVLNLNLTLQSFLHAKVPCIQGVGSVRPRGPIPKHPVPASRSPLCRVLVGYLVHISSSKFLKSQIGMERTFPLTKYFFKPVCFRKRFIHYLILLLHSSVVIPMIVINRHHRSFRITEGQATKEQFQDKREFLRQFDQVVL